MTIHSLLLMLTGLLAPQFPAPSPTAADLDGVVVPRKTEIFIALQRSINSKTASAGDKFSATVQVPVTHQDRILIPVGSFIIGHVVYKKNPGRFKGKAELQLAFDTVILTDGTTRIITAAVTSAEGLETHTEEEDGTLQKDGKKGEKTVDGAIKGGTVGAISGAGVGIFRGGVGRGAGIGAVVGAASGAALALLQKGEDVELPRGASLTIQLQEDITFVKPETVAQQGQRLKP